MTEEEGGSRAVLEAGLLADDKCNCIGADQVRQVAPQRTLRRTHLGTKAHAIKQQAALFKRTQILQVQ